MGCADGFSYDALSMWVSVASLAVAVLAFWIGVRSLRIADKSLTQAVKDWRQSKWFDLYFAGNEAYDFLDEFQAKHCGKSPDSWSPGALQDWNQ